MQSEVIEFLTIAFAAVACFVSLGTLVWKSSSLASQQKSFEEYSKSIEADRKVWKENLERSLEQRFAAMGGANTLCQQQIAELRENIAKNYMTKPEIERIEARVTNSQDRIADHLDRIDTRLNEMQTRVLEAINKATARG